ncbi:NUDIX hydrolase [Nocardioidaceae bacterium]|nr:NUDIX hydrolase [Nocardioidaceae bacterium]
MDDERDEARLDTSVDGSGEVSRRWDAFSSRTVYDGPPWLRVELVDVQTPTGRRFEHHVVRMQRVVVCVPLSDPGDSVLMMRRHRFVDDSWGWELPTGIVEAGEDPAAAAVRELREETGWQATGCTEALTFQPMLGIADSPHQVFVLDGLSHAGEPTDAEEAGATRWVEVDELLAMVSGGEIRDGASVTAVLYLLASRTA